MITLRVWEDTIRDGWISSWDYCDTIEEAREVAGCLIAFPAADARAVEVQILDGPHVKEVYR